MSNKLRVLIGDEGFEYDEKNDCWYFYHDGGSHICVSLDTETLIEQFIKFNIDRAKRGEEL